MYRYRKIIMLLALGVATSASCGRSRDSRVDPVRRYGWTAATTQRQLLLEAIAIANQILQDDVRYRLTPGWEPRSDAAASVPVYWLEPFRLAWSDRIFVPADQRIIVINAQSLRSYLNTIAAPKDQVQLLAAILLHELGHIVQGHQGHWENAEGISPEILNAADTPQKNRELQADRFAAGQIKQAMEPGQNVSRFTAAIKVGTALTMASFRVSAKLQSEFFGDTSGRRHLDSGYSHPNLALRLLIILHQITGDATTKQTVEDILRSRESQQPTILFRSSSVSGIRRTHGASQR